MIRQNYIMVVISLLVFNMPFGDAWSQQGIIRVSPDGSLFILENTGTGSKRPSEQGNLYLLGSQLHVKVIRGSSQGWNPPPIITRGRGSRERHLLSALPPSQPALPHTSLQPDTPLAPLIEKSAQDHGIDPGLVRLVIQKESGFNPQAVSPKGAMGLMQLMPGTASLLGVQDPFNPAQNIDGGVRYLKQCLERFNNNVCLALAAYNAGPENVTRYHGVPPFAETRNYVDNIMRAYTGNPTDLPELPKASSTQPSTAGQIMAKKLAFSHADLQPLFLPGGARINVTQVGKSKIIDIVER
jgi:hypothetical protein